MLGMTFEEFLKQMDRLHRRYPNIYRRAEQVRIAFHLYGVPLEWFKDRVDYVIISGRGHFDWVDAIQRARRSNRFVEVAGEEQVPKLNISPVAPIEEILHNEGVSSVVELLEKKKGGGDGI